MGCVTVLDVKGIYRSPREVGVPVEYSTGLDTEVVSGGACDYTVSMVSVTGLDVPALAIASYERASPCGEASAWLALMPLEESAMVPASGEREEQGDGRAIKLWCAKPFLPSLFCRAVYFTVLTHQRQTLRRSPYPRRRATTQRYV